MTNLPYKVECAIVAGPQVTTGRIIRYQRLWATLTSEGRQVIFIRGGKRLHPGCYAGGAPVIKLSDIPTKDARVIWDGEVGDFYVHILETEKLIYGGFCTRHSAASWAKENGYNPIG